MRVAFLVERVTPSAYSTGFLRGATDKPCLAVDGYAVRKMSRRPVKGFGKPRAGVWTDHARETRGATIVGYGLDKAIAQIDGKPQF